MEQKYVKYVGDTTHFVDMEMPRPISVTSGEWVWTLTSEIFNFWNCEEIWHPLVMCVLGIPVVDHMSLMNVTRNVWLKLPAVMNKWHMKQDAWKTLICRN